MKRPSPRVTSKEKKSAPGFLIRKWAYSVGELSIALDVAPRTVSKWIDTGKLQGYRVPAKEGDSGDRRAIFSAVQQFIRQHQIPVHIEGDTDSVLIISNDGTLTEAVRQRFGDLATITNATCWFQAGLHISAGKFTVAIVDLAMGRTVALQAIREIRRMYLYAAIVAVACEDESASWEVVESGASMVLTRGVDMAIPFADASGIFFPGVPKEATC